MSIIRFIANAAPYAEVSELVKNAQSLGPQAITLHGKSVAVVVSREMFERLSHTQNSLVDFMQRPLFEADDIELERDNSLTREVEF